MQLLASCIDPLSAKCMQTLLGGTNSHLDPYCPLNACMGCCHALNSRRTLVDQSSSRLTCHTSKQQGHITPPLGIFVMCAPCLQLCPFPFLPPVQLCIASTCQLQHQGNTALLVSPTPTPKGQCIESLTVNADEALGSPGACLVLSERSALSSMGMLAGGDCVIASERHPAGAGALTDGCCGPCRCWNAVATAVPAGLHRDFTFWVGHMQVKQEHKCTHACMQCVVFRGLGFSCLCQVYLLHSQVLCTTC